jgi:hypothetical protein
LLFIELAVCVLFLLKFFEAPSFDAAVVFAFINSFSLSILLYFRNRNPPMPYDDEIEIGQALPAVIVAVIAIYGIARVSSSVLGSPSTFLPNTSYSLIPLYQQLAGLPSTSTISTTITLDSVQSLANLLLWNFSVAGAEESFKVALVNLSSTWFIRKNISQQTSVVLSSGIVVGLWTYYHYFQSIQTTSGLAMAFFAGAILMAMVYYLKNLVPSVVGHWIWNVLSAILP